jgi:MFS family permease
MQNMLQLTAFESGLILLPGAIVMGIMSPVTGRLFDKFGARWLSIIGVIILVITTFMLSNLTQNTTFIYLAVVNAIRMFAVSMVLMPVTTAGLNELPPELIAHGTAMNNTMRQVAGAVGTAVLVTVMTNYSVPAAGVSGLIHGVNISFIVAGIIASIGLLLSFFIKNKQAKVESFKVSSLANENK